MRCSKCGADNREGRKFCTQCGSTLAAKCPRCGAAVEPAEKFCGECGTALGTPPAALGKSHEPQIQIADTPDPEHLEVERKTITALFADIKGSTELEQDLDPEDARAIIDPALNFDDRRGSSLRRLYRSVHRRRHLRTVRRTRGARGPSPTRPLLCAPPARRI